MIPSTISKKHFPIISDACDQFAWDIDGKKYLDFTGANLTVILGYQGCLEGPPPNFPGMSFLEVELAEKLKDLTGYNHFRFFKNGKDAVDCALRLARHIEGVNSRIGFMGYHGSGNEYVWTTDNKNGIPEQNSFQQRFIPGCDVYNFTEADILCYESRYKDFKITRGAFKIVDTLKEGMRALFNDYSDDLVIYGKSIANGYPLAVLTGKDEVMERLPEIYYSTTFGGENVAIQEALLAIDYYKQVKESHEELLSYAKKLPAWRSFNPKEIKHFLDRGILNNGYWQIMTCHTKADIDKLEEAYSCLPKG